MIFTVRALNTINQLPELTVPAAEHNVELLCLQEYRYYYSVLELKSHDTGNSRKFTLAFAWKNSVDVTIGVGMLLSSDTLKSLNNQE